MELGPALLALWQSQLTLLSLALELLHYLEDPLWPLGTSCQLSHFGYDSLTVTFGEHSVSVGHMTDHMTCQSPVPPSSSLSMEAWPALTSPSLPSALTHSSRSPSSTAYLPLCLCLFY